MLLTNAVPADQSPLWEEPADDLISIPDIHVEQLRSRLKQLFDLIQVYDQPYDSVMHVTTKGGIYLVETKLTDPNTWNDSEGLGAIPVFLTALKGFARSALPIAASIAMQYLNRTAAGGSRPGDVQDLYEVGGRIDLLDDNDKVVDTQSYTYAVTPSTVVAMGVATPPTGFGLDRLERARDVSPSLERFPRNEFFSQIGRIIRTTLDRSRPALANVQSNVKNPLVPLLRTAAGQVGKDLTRLIDSRSIC